MGGGFCCFASDRRGGRGDERLTASQIYVIESNRGERGRYDA